MVGALARWVQAGPRPNPRFIAAKVGTPEVEGWRDLGGSNVYPIMDLRMVGMVAPLGRWLTNGDGCAANLDRAT